MALIWTAEAVLHPSAVGKPWMLVRDVPHIGFEPQLFNVGEAVRHKKFGPGEVVEISGENVTVAFGNPGTKRVKARFLKKAA